MDIFFEPATEKINVRVGKKTKALIEKHTKRRNLKESQYLKLAIQNQLSIDENNEPKI